MPSPTSVDAAFSFDCSIEIQALGTARWRGRPPAAWPLLAPPSGPDHVRTQPLVRIWYWPTDVDLFTDELRASGALESSEQRRPARATDLVNAFVFLHEIGHLWYLDWTPAKELARTYLAYSYDQLTALMFRVEQRVDDVQSFAALGNFSARLGAVYREVGLVEELVATAGADLAIRDQMAEGGRWAGFESALDALVARVLDAEEASLPGFAALYPVALRLVRHLRSSTKIVAAAVPLLQRVATDDPVHALNAVPDLVAVEAALTEEKDVENRTARLEQLNAARDQDWWVALGLQLAAIGEPEVQDDGARSFVGPYARMVWRISRGELAPNDSGDPAGRAADWARYFRVRLTEGRQVGPGASVLLEPVQLDRGRTMINARWWRLPGDEPPAGLRADHLGIARLEALRQQILARTGFVCPEYRGDGKCRCNPPFQRAVWHLHELAREGLFGPGSWERPGCR